MSAPPVLVFDLDGTLVDTAPDLFTALNVVLADAGHAPVEAEIARTMVGRGARMMITRAFAARGAAIEGAALDRANERFLAVYEGCIADGSRAFPGVEPALDRFAAAGYRLAVCTNKYERLSKLLLEALGLSGRFAAIAGQETFGVCKPHPDHILKTVAAAGGDPATAIMVGDSVTDVDAARAAKVPIVGVTFGYTDVPMQALSPDVAIDHFDALWDAVAGLGRR